ncbi:MAG: SMP-30/gluconolactonase/LRE family protein, partial [Bacteroidota bacterium]|nr:SMP-30/gluconolactonase/LRE family protein [Bacteroidota bacterium]
MHYTYYTSLLLLGCWLAGACQRGQKETADSTATNSTATTDSVMTQMPITTTGSILKLDDRLDQIIKPGAKIEVLAKGFTWSEGPVWLPQDNKLLFSDIPPNKIYQWTEESGLELYLTPSGYTSSQPRGGEVGSNGLILDKEGRLVLCQHGDRRMARMDAPLRAPKPNFVTIADRYEGKRLNSPN